LAKALLHYNIAPPLKAGQYEFEVSGFSQIVFIVLISHPSFAEGLT
jgi:hypothetical protein